MVLAGLVIPPSLVRSAVDAALPILIDDLRREISVAIRISGFTSYAKALVRSDSFRSV